MKTTNHNKVRLLRKSKSILFLLLIGASTIANPIRALASITGGTVNNISWSIWGQDKNNSICFVIGDNGVNKTFVFDFSNNKQGKTLAAALVAALHSGKKVTVEHMDEAKYSCGMLPDLAKDVVGFIFDK